MRAAQEVKKNLPDTLLTNPIMNRFFESFLSIEVHVLIRFGRWSEILSREVPTDHQVRCVRFRVTSNNCHLIQSD